MRFIPRLYTKTGVSKAETSDFVNRVVRLLFAALVDLQWPVARLPIMHVWSVKQLAYTETSVVVSVAAILSMATPTLRGAQMFHTYHVAIEALCRASIVCAEDVCDRIRQAICLCG